MFRKVGLALSGLLLSCSLSVTVFAADISEGRQYQNVEKAMSGVPPVVEFFSFYCPHCYEFEQVMHMHDSIKNSLPAGTEYVQYHVDFMGPLAKDLSHAWAVALSIGVTDKVIGPLFDGIQKTRTIHSTEDIRNVFLEATGISQQEYDSAWDSFVVKSLVVRQQKAAADFRLSGVPSLYVNGKYMLNIEGMDRTSVKAFTDSYIKTVNYLLSKK